MSKPLEGGMESLDSTDWLLRWFSLMLAGLVFTLTLNAEDLATPAWLIVRLGLFLTLATYLLLPAAKGPTGLIRNSLAGLPLLFLLAQISVPGMLPLVILCRVGGVVASLSFLIWSLQQYITLYLPENHPPDISLLALLALATSLPVWLGPAVELYQPGEAAVNGFVLLSPLTHIAVAADYDYLRNEWFYQNSPLGSLRFSYPSLTSIISSYLLLTLFIQAARWWKTNRTRSKQPAEQYSDPRP